EYEALHLEIEAQQAPAQGGFKKAMPSAVLQQKTQRKNALEGIIKQDLADDIVAIGANNTRYKQGLETMRAMAKKRLEHDKDAVAEYQKSKRANDLQTAVHETANVGRDIQMLLETAEQENRNFGKSWFEYRTFNPQAVAHHLPDDVADDF